MSFWYDAIARYYKMGFYTEDNMRTFVKAKKITEDDFEVITGTPYNVPVTPLEPTTPVEEEQPPTEEETPTTK